MDILGLRLFRIRLARSRYLLMLGTRPDQPRIFFVFFTNTKYLPASVSGLWTLLVIFPTVPRMNISDSERR